MAKDKRVIIIGAGLAGLGSAALLAKSGFDVTVLEKGSKPGGVAQGFEVDGYRFDSGPTWYLMPEVFERFFDLLGARVEDCLDLVQLVPSYKIFFEDGSEAVLSPDLEENAELFESLEPGGGRRLRRYLAHAQQKYEAALAHFLYREFESPQDFLDPRLLKLGLQLNVFGRLDRYVGRYFRDKRAQQIAQFNTVFLGSSPKKTPALYSLMSHADLTQGVFYPTGGIAAVVEAIHGLAEELGVRFHFDEAATAIQFDSGRAVGVLSEREFYEADHVVAACDYHFADTELTAPHYRVFEEKQWASRTLAPSTFLLYLGVDAAEIPGLEHHNFYFASEWERHFRDLFDEPRWPENPCYYVSCPSLSDRTVAPKGKHGLFVLVPVAADVDDSDSRRDGFEGEILRHLDRLLGFSVSSRIEHKTVVSSRDFARNHNLWRGTALGLSHTLFQTAIFRPPRQNPKVPNLLYTGHYTQPGIGMPMALISAELLAGRLRRLG